MLDIKKGDECEGRGDEALRKREGGGKRDEIEETDCTV